MKVEVLKNDETEMEIILVGEGHTFANLLRKTLKKDENVIHAAYKVGHPLIDKDRPVIQIKTNGKESPKKVLAKAAQEIKEQMIEFEEKFQGVW
jgi:DNA-directed RNA polymerase subunit L